jgi:hypothetical protein
MKQVVQGDGEIFWRISSLEEAFPIATTAWHKIVAAWIIWKAIDTFYL